MTKTKPPVQAFKVVGECFLAGVPPSRQRIDRVVNAHTPEQAAEVAFLGFHGSIHVVADARGFTSMFGSRACGHVTVTEVKP